jgi:CheY-like chemotaxis protein
MGSVLVIDDEKMVLNVIESALREFGYRVEIAEDGEEGIRKFDTDNFDIVITDLIMPNLDGNGVVDHIRNTRKRWIPIIGISGTPWVLEKEHVDEILTKPFPLKILIDAVETLSTAALV